MNVPRATTAAWFAAARPSALIANKENLWTDPASARITALRARKSDMENVMRARMAILRARARNARKLIEVEVIKHPAL